MGSTPTTRWQVGGYRFLVRRLEHALVRRDTRMMHDPMRTRSRALVVGSALTAVALAGCAVLALLRPQGAIGDAAIVIGKDSGAMFVVDDDVLHPVTGLASARLVVGKPDEPATVSEGALTSRPRGPLVGIPGAPSTVPIDPKGARVAWTVCDTRGARADSVTSTSIVVSGDADAVGTQSESVATPLDKNAAALWSREGTAYLVYNGTRARIDLADVRVTRALGVDGATAVPVSSGLLDAVREVPAIVSPFIANAGSPTLYNLGGRTVGSVVMVDLGDRVQNYVALTDGVQPITSATAQLIRFADSQGALGIDSVAPDLISRAPQTRSPLPVDTLPDTAPTLIDSRSNPVSCVTWRENVATDDTEQGVASTVVVSSGRDIPNPTGSKPVALVGADGSGDGLDSVYLPPGIGYFVQSIGIGPGAAAAGSTFYIADTGVRYGVPDAESASSLDLSIPKPVPWDMIELFAPGPALSRADARVAHDGVAPDPDGAVLVGGS